MYAYTEFDRRFIRERAAQYRDQLERHLAGQLSDEEFRPLRLQNGWYVQRHAPMLRVAVPYGEVSSAQLRVLARIAREFDQPDPALLAQAQSQQDAIGSIAGPRLAFGCGHFTTRQNVQFNWIALDRSADVMDLLASVDMHGIQTSGNCIRNITTDALAGIAVDEVTDPRPFAEILRQWSTLHPEFSFLPRKFKVAISGAPEDRAATAWHDVGLHLLRNAQGELGLRVLVGGGMGRTPVIATVLREFLPWQQMLNYLEAVLRVYNRFGRRDNIYKARIKILVKAEGQRFIDEVEAEYQAIIENDGAAHTLTQLELDRISSGFAAPAQADEPITPEGDDSAAGRHEPQFVRWLQRNVELHRNPALRAVTLSFKRPGQAPGDATAEQLEQAAELAERFSAGQARVTHEQNLLLPWVRVDQLPRLWQEARRYGLARPNIGLLTDLIACPGGDFCALANARSLPLAEALAQRYQDLDELEDLGPIDFHISGCINSCGHHHSGHIGILGVDKDGQEWYQVTLGGSDGALRGGPARPGRVVGPSFSMAEVADVVEALLETYRRQRLPLAGGMRESFVQTVARLGLEPFKAAAEAARHPVPHAPATTLA